jgi:hypothetical protein
MFCLSICILYKSYILPAWLLATSRIPDTNKFYIILSGFNCSTRPKFSGSCHDSCLPNINPLATLTPVIIFESKKEFVVCFVLMAFLSYCIVHSWILPQWVITMYKANLTFVFPCIVSVITIDNQQDATIWIYSLLISSTCFGRCFADYQEHITVNTASDDGRKHRPKHVELVRIK